MRFSILSLVVCTLICALAFNGYAIYLEGFREQTLIKQLASETDTLESTAFFSQVDDHWPADSSVILVRRSQLKEIEDAGRQLVERLEAAFDKSRARAGTVTPVDDRLVVRRIPTIQRSGQAQSEWSLHCPSSSTLRLVVDFQSPGGDETLVAHYFQDQGRRSAALPQGFSQLTISYAPDDQGTIVLDVTLNDEVVCRLPWKGEAPNGLSYSTPVLDQQRAYPLLDQRLPTLSSIEPGDAELKIRIWVETVESGDE